jgi:uncharacterized membrane protein YbjE (DUF340 family)
MKESVLYIILIILGVISSSSFSILNKWNLGTEILLLVLFFIGLSVGADKNFAQNLTIISPKILLMPIGTCLGTYIAAICFAVIIPIFTIKESLLIASGFGFYSLSSSMVSLAIPGNLGLIVFFTNLLRELFVLLFAKQLIQIFGNGALIPVSASASDMCLPIISAHLGEDKVFEAMFNSILFTILVPVFIELIIGLSK